MTRLRFGLFGALILSTVFHVLPFASALLTSAPPAPVPPPPLQARLAPPPSPAPDVPLKLEQPAPVARERKISQQAEPVNPQKAAKTSRTWQQVIRQQFIKQQADGEFYPAEAIARGQQGEVLVLILLDAQGKVSAARVEQACDFPILDQAALQAVRKLHSLPADAPREIVLPVRFKLH